MLKVFFGLDYDANLYVDVFFNHVFEHEWLEDDLVSLLGEIKELSGCMEIVSNVIYNRDLVKLIHNYILVDLVDRQIWVKKLIINI